MLKTVPSKYSDNISYSYYEGVIEYINIILVLNNKVIQNNLFIDESLANSNFVNLICEYGFSPDGNVTKEWASIFIKDKFFTFPNGSITINHPTINF